MGKNHWYQVGYDFRFDEKMMGFYLHYAVLLVYQLFLHCSKQLVNLYLRCIIFCYNFLQNGTKCQICILLCITYLVCSLNKIIDVEGSHITSLFFNFIYLINRVFMRIFPFSSSWTYNNIKNIQFKKNYFSNMKIKENV